jgi:protein-disulfide isomerase
MSSSYNESTGSVLKKFLPLIIGGVVILALLISGFIFVRSKLGGGAQENTINTYVRPYHNTVGKADAPVKFVYLFDYSCPACQSNAENMTKLVADPEFKDNVQFVYKNFIVHPGDGDRNALASNAAGLQGKYLEYHEKLIAVAKTVSGKVTENQFITIANELNLDIPKFKKDKESKELEVNLKTDQNDIRNALVAPSEYAPGKVRPDATPSVVMLKDGKLVTWWSGVIPLDDSNSMTGVKSRIDKVIGESNPNPSSALTTTSESK